MEPNTRSKIILKYHKIKFSPPLNILNHTLPYIDIPHNTLLLLYLFPYLIHYYIFNFTLSLDLNNNYYRIINSHYLYSYGFYLNFLRYIIYQLMNFHIKYYVYYLNLCLNYYYFLSFSQDCYYWNRFSVLYLAECNMLYYLSYFII